MNSIIDGNKSILFKLCIVIPKMIIFYHNLKLHEMIDIHSKFYNMHTNEIFYVLICIKNHINLCINCMLSTKAMPGDDDGGERSYSSDAMSTMRRRKP